MNGSEKKKIKQMTLQCGWNRKDRLGKRARERRRCESTCHAISYVIGIIYRYITNL